MAVAMKRPAVAMPVRMPIIGALRSVLRSIRKPTLLLQSFPGRQRWATRQILLSIAERALN